MLPRLSLAAFAATAASAFAQCPPGAPMPSDVSIETTMPENGAAATRWKLGHDALLAGDFANARTHLLGALEYHPSSPVLLLDLALACRDDAELGPQWSERLVRAAADAQGRVKWDANAQKALRAAAGFDALLKPAQELALLRAAALVEVARFIDKQKPGKAGNGARAVLVRWASELLLDLGIGAPTALAAQAPAVQKVQDAFTPDHDLLVAALAKVMALKPAKPDAAPSTGAAAASEDAALLEDRRVRAARILVGLRRQGGQKDLKGPPALPIGKPAEDAQRLLDEQLSKNVQAGKVWSIAELEAMTPPERVRFTDQHAHWYAPAIALSTTGRYRVETTCGHTTLLETAKTVELHHARLVSHYGVDPFLERQGQVRIVPKVTDLETEGAPFWWAGGFQGGDKTTIIFAWGNIPGLGRTITHELTHRFDGVLRPFLGAWYGEGHASWTGAHYGRMRETNFVDDYLNPGDPAHSWYKGYGDRGKFEQLLKGEVEDYRDNYPVGYSLYAFLRNYPRGKPRYRDALLTYEKNARAGQKDPLAYFTSTFCDGKNGRPAKFDDFFTEWQGFLRGCYEFGDERSRNDSNRWVGEYGRLPGQDDAPEVMDAPTWSWDRVRAEPFYGQGHAADAVHLLHEVGDAEGTIAAGVWSLAVDGWRRDVCERLLAALRTAKANDAAAAFATIAARHFPELGGGEAATLLLALPKSKQLLDALAARAAALASPAPKTAAVVATEHGRLAQLFGLPAKAPNVVAAPPLPRHLGGHGWTETSLTGFEERRHKGLWYATADGDLHVGREKPRESTGTLDRAAHQRDAFAHSVAWQAPGAYVLRGRVHFTTSYVSGAIVFGHVRRDRDLRLTFSSGDFDYATGRRETNERKGRVSFGLQGLWARDGKFAERTGHTAEQAGDQNWFDYELRIRGPRVMVLINGEACMQYSVYDGTPIEGHVGFAMGMGAVRVQTPTVQRLDGVGDAVAGLDLAAPTASAFEDLLLLPVRGVPRHANGTLVLWLPQLEEDQAYEMGRAIPSLAKLLNTPHEYPQPWVVAVPKALPAEQRTRVLDAVRSVRDQPLPIVEHGVAAPFTGRLPWVLFVDGDGVLRAGAQVGDPQLHSRVTKWSRYFRPR